MTKLYNGLTMEELWEIYASAHETYVIPSSERDLEIQAIEAVAEACSPRWHYDDPPLSERCKLAPVYVLAVDDKNRMSVGYAYRLSGGEIHWIFAKPIGHPVAWIHLPQPPQSKI